MAQTPIDTEALARAVGATTRQSVDTISGGLSLEGDRFVISVNPREPRQRQRFTIAHEVGHILLMEAGADHVRDLSPLTHQQANPIIESVCNQVAAELLMPRQTFFTHLLSAPLAVTSIERESARFDVSIEAALRRTAEVLTQTDIVLLTKHRLTRGVSLEFKTRLVQHSGVTTRFPKWLKRRDCRPDLFTKADAKGRGFSSSFKIEWPGARPLSRRALVLSTLPTSDVGADVQHQGDHTEQKRRQFNMDYLLLLQGYDAPDDEWTRLTGKTVRPSTHLKEKGLG